MTPDDIVKAKVLPEDAKFLVALIKVMAKEIVRLREAVSKLEGK